MPKPFKVREIKSKAEMLEQYSLILQLTVNLKEKDFKRMLDEMLSNGYRMAGVFDGKKCIGVSGYWMGTKLYSDKYLEPDNVVIDKAYRSMGVGKLLMDWLEKEAVSNGCKTIMLDAYVENLAGHKFYFREGFVARGFHFLKKI